MAKAIDKTTLHHFLGGLVVCAVFALIGGPAALVGAGAVFGVYMGREIGQEQYKIAKKEKIFVSQVGFRGVNPFKWPLAQQIDLLAPAIPVAALIVLVLT